MGKKPSRDHAKVEPSRGEVALYRSASGVVQVECLLRDETLWLTQKALAELFGVQRPAVTKHLRNIFFTGELAEEAVCSILEHTSADGKRYTTKHYNLDAVIAVGYRVNRLSTQLSGTVGLSDPQGQRKGRHAGSETESGAGVRGLPSAAGCRIHLRLRPRSETFERGMNHGRTSTSTPSVIV